MPRPSCKLKVYRCFIPCLSVLQAWTEQHLCDKKYTYTFINEFQLSQDSYFPFSSTGPDKRLRHNYIKNKTSALTLIGWWQTPHKMQWRECSTMSHMITIVHSVLCPPLLVSCMSKDELYYTTPLSFTRTHTALQAYTSQVWQLNTRHVTHFRSPVLYR